MSRDRILEIETELEKLEELGFKSDMGDHELQNALYNLWGWGFSTGKLFEQGKFTKLDGRQFEMVDKVFGQIKSSFLNRQLRAAQPPITKEQGENDNE